MIGVPRWKASDTREREGGGGGRDMRSASAMRGARRPKHGGGCWVSFCNVGEKGVGRFEQSQGSVPRFCPPLNRGELNRGTLSCFATGERSQSHDKERPALPAGAIYE